MPNCFFKDLAISFRRKIRPRKHNFLKTFTYIFLCRFLAFMCAFFASRNKQNQHYGENQFLRGCGCSDDGERGMAGTLLQHQLERDLAGKVRGQAWLGKSKPQRQHVMDVLYVREIQEPHQLEGTFREYQTEVFLYCLTGKVRRQVGLERYFRKQRTDSRFCREVRRPPELVQDYRQLAFLRWLRHGSFFEEVSGADPFRAVPWFKSLEKSFGEKTGWNPLSNQHGMTKNGRLGDRFIVL